MDIYISLNQSIGTMLYYSIYVSKCKLLRKSNKLSSIAFRTSLFDFVLYFPFVFRNHEYELCKSFPIQTIFFGKKNSAPSSVESRTQ